MKTLVLSIMTAAFCVTALAQGTTRPVGLSNPIKDTVKLKTSGEQSYYQDTVKTDSISERLIYLRAIQFMASKNFQQNYGYQEEGKLIFTTAQDLNVNSTNVNDDNEAVDPYTVQFSISLDIKAHSYRYTIGNILFFRPTDNGNRRETLYDIYKKETNTDSRRIAKYANKFLASFEKYLDVLLAELRAAVEQKSPIYSKF
jgi:hypothetical protein